MSSGFPLMQWRTAAAAGPEGAEAALAGGLSITRPAARALLARGLGDVAAARAYLSPRLSDLSDPFLIPQLELGAARVWRAIEAQEAILVFGDYDVDGVSSAALMTLVLRQLGARVAVFLPHRFDDGYGLTPEAVRQCLKAEHPGLLITVDCGITASAAVEEAKAHGVDVVITDHHEPAESLPDACAVINPKLGGAEAARMLSGVGVAFKFCHGLLKLGLGRGRMDLGHLDLRQYLDIVALGTIADVVPLTGENRILARHGLKRLAEAPRIGLRRLMAVAGIDPAKIQAHHIGFGLGPRLNAAGRMGSAGAALDLLLTEDPAEADRLALVLEQANNERKRIEDDLYDTCVRTLEAATPGPAEAFGLVVGGTGWHLGTVGIVAARLVRRYARPAIVIGFDASGKGRGSCRSIAGFDMLAALGACSGCLDGFGGHTMAAGVSLSAGNLAAFQASFREECRRTLTGQDLRPVQPVDAWISLAEADHALLRDLAGLQPFGTGNPAPTFGIRGASLAAAPRRIGKKANHLRLSISQGSSVLAGVGFNLGTYAVPEGQKLDLVFHLQENDFRGQSTVEMQIKDLSASDPSN